MKNVAHILMLIALLGSESCDGTRRESENEMFVINELFMLRTEGMILCQIAEAADSDGQILNACDRFHAYYAATQPEFLSLCDGRSIALDESDFDTIWKNVERGVKKNAVFSKSDFITLTTDNILRSIALHEIILERMEWEDVSYYAFKSLPELYNQQQLLSDLRRSEHENSPETRVAEVHNGAIAL